MKSPKNFSLSSLAFGRRDEIDQMLAGIRGDSDTKLWTRDMRAAVRGGKCRLIGVSAEKSASR